MISIIASAHRVQALAAWSSHRRARHDQPLPPGSAGRLLVRGHCVMKAYYNNLPNTGGD